MDNKTFKEKLTEVAEWRVPDIKLDGVERRKQAGRKPQEESYQEQHEKTFYEMFEGKNPFAAPELVKVKIQPKDCEDCGQHCENGRQTEIKFYKDRGQIPHSRTRCMICNQFRNPITGNFDLSMGRAPGVYQQWAKACYKLKNKDDQHSPE